MARGVRRDRRVRFNIAVLLVAASLVACSGAFDPVEKGGSSDDNDDTPDDTTDDTPDDTTDDPLPTIDAGPPVEESAAKLVFDTDVSPILQNSCNSCHGTGGGGTFPTFGTTYESYAAYKNGAAVLLGCNLGGSLLYSKGNHSGVTYPTGANLDKIGSLIMAHALEDPACP
jgi:hypothetical protein